MVSGKEKLTVFVIFLFLFVFLVWFFVCVLFVGVVRGHGRESACVGIREISDDSVVCCVELCGGRWSESERMNICWARLEHGLPEKVRFSIRFAIELRTRSVAKSATQTREGWSISSEKENVAPVARWSEKRIGGAPSWRKVEYLLRMDRLAFTSYRLRSSENEQTRCTTENTYIFRLFSLVL